jgi:poly-beta-1,6-N-acetyl-D-glucosamine biosynthesis protein PgaD
MKSLILDRFASQSLHKRCLWHSLTSLGWAFWIYLWLPLLGSIEVYLGISSADTISTSQSFRELLAILGSHATVVVMMIAGFLAWSLLQWQGNRQPYHASINRGITPRRLAQSVRLPERDLTAWQLAQRMVVTHDADSGWIYGVDVLSALDERPRIAA